MIQKNSEKKVHFPRSFLVNLRDNGELDWLPPKQVEDDDTERQTERGTITDRDIGEEDAEMTEILDSPKKMIDIHIFNNILNMYTHNISLYT